MLKYLVFLSVLFSTSWSSLVDYGSLVSDKINEVDVVSALSSTTLTPIFAGSNAAANGATIVATKNASPAGTTIWVSPGAYTISETIAKHGVNWWFSPGAIVTGTNCSIFDDTNAETDFIVGGQGKFITNRTVVSLRHASSTVVMDCISVESTATNVYGAIGTSSQHGTLYINASECIKSAYDGVLVDGGLWFITTPYMWADDNCFEVTGGAVYANIDYAKSNQAVIMEAIYGIWHIKKIETVNGSCALLTGGGGMVIFDQMIANGSGSAVSFNGACTLKGGTIQSTSASYPAIFLEGSDGVLDSVKVISAGTYSIDGAEEQTVTLQGTIEVNTPFNMANIIVEGNAVVINSTKGTAKHFNTEYVRNSITISNSTYNLQHETLVFLNGADGAATAVLPTSPDEGMTYTFVGLDDNNACTIDRNGKLINNSASNKGLAIGESLTLSYDGIQWWISGSYVP
jgi:hypothetical protein